MLFIQRRTVAEALTGTGGFTGVDARAAPASNRRAPYFRGDGARLPGRFDTYRYQRAGFIAPPSAFARP
jgi:hypothetical protein